MGEKLHGSVGSNTAAYKDALYMHEDDQEIRTYFIQCISLGLDVRQRGELEPNAPQSITSQ